MSSYPIEYNKIFFEKELGDEPKGLGYALKRIVGKWKRRNGVLSSMRCLVEEALIISERLSSLDEFEIKRELDEHKKYITLNRNRSLELDPLSLAFVYEASRRKLKMEPYSVQMLAVVALYKGYLAEVDTGEGKTLSIAMAGAIAAWSGGSVHIITANDYLASRDADQMKEFFAMLGVTVSCVVSETSNLDRLNAYKAMITYSTSKEVAADYLRDKIVLSAIGRSAKRRYLEHLAGGIKPNIVQRGLHRAFIDEADNCLIDEAVTPLIISQDYENSDLGPVCDEALKLASRLKKDVDFSVIKNNRTIKIHNSAKEKVINENTFPDSPIWKCPKRRSQMLKLALEAQYFFKRGEQYIVDSDKVIIVDESTGRPMPNRSWKMGLHQMVESREGINVTMPTITVAQSSFQSFFKKYGVISGATGTAQEVSDEIWQTYGMPVLNIPRNRPNIRSYEASLFFKSTESKENCILKFVTSKSKTGQPILIGTRSVKASERLSDLFIANGLKCEVLNARKLNEEARIISEAGKLNRITIATNMAGRGTDIKLGYGVKELGGIHVISTEPHESRRVDRQLYGRAGRQGDPGKVSAFYSMSDDLFQKNLPGFFLRIMKLSLVGDNPKGKSSFVCSLMKLIAQFRAEKIDRFRRKSVSNEEDKLKAGLGFAGDS